MLQQVQKDLSLQVIRAEVRGAWYIQPVPVHAGSTRQCMKIQGGTSTQYFITAHGQHMETATTKGHVGAVGRQGKVPWQIPWSQTNQLQQLPHTSPALCYVICFLQPAFCTARPRTPHACMYCRTAHLSRMATSVSRYEGRAPRSSAPGSAARNRNRASILCMRLSCNTVHQAHNDEKG